MKAEVSLFTLLIESVITGVDPENVPRSQLQPACPPLLGSTYKWLVLLIWAPNALFYCIARLSMRNSASKYVYLIKNFA